MQLNREDGVLLDGGEDWECRAHPMRALATDKAPYAYRFYTWTKRVGRDGETWSYATATKCALSIESLDAISDHFIRTGRTE